MYLYTVRHVILPACAAPLPQHPTPRPTPRYNKSSGQAELIGNCLVRVEGVEPSSHAWEAYIIAVIRYPQAGIILAHWRHERQGLAAHLTSWQASSKCWLPTLHRLAVAVAAYYCCVCNCSMRLVRSAISAQLLPCVRIAST